MGPERDGLPVMILRVVDDADALHGAAASGMMTTSSPRSLARRVRPHYRITIDRCDNRARPLGRFTVASSGTPKSRAGWGTRSRKVLMYINLHFFLLDRIDLVEVLPHAIDHGMEM
jgi:hypothetical protein